jgi:hypothetical protein
MNCVAINADLASDCLRRRPSPHGDDHQLKNPPS